MILAAIALSLLWAGSPAFALRGGEGSPTAAMFVPKQAPLVTSLIANPERLQNLVSKAELQRFEQGLLGSSELDYQRDVQPWLGDEVTAAITTLDIDRDASNGKETGYLLALATKDAPRSREFLQLFWQKRALQGTELVFETFKGSKLIYGKVVQAETPLTLATAVVGDRYVLFANSPKVLRDAINNVQAAELNLLNAPSYKSAIAKLKDDRVALGFFNLPELAALTGKPILPGQERLAIGLDLAPQGLVAETALLGNGRSTAMTATLKKPVPALKYVPAASSLVAAGQDLQQLWAKSGASELGLVTQSLNNLQNKWQINLAQDIFSWVKTEYAVALLPREVNQQQKLDWVFVTDNSTPEAQQGIAHLSQIAKDRGVGIGSLKLGDRTVEVWTRLATEKLIARDSIALEAQVVGTHTAIDQYEVFTTSIEAMNTVLNASKTVANSKAFDRAIAPLQKPNSGYFYVDWNSSRPILEQQFPFLRLVELAGKPLFERLNAIALSNYSSESGIQHSGVVLQLDH
jgi:hypothetical protein